MSYSLETQNKPTLFTLSLWLHWNFLNSAQVIKIFIAVVVLAGRIFPLGEKKIPYKYFRP